MNFSVSLSHRECEEEEQQGKREGERTRRKIERLKREVSFPTRSL
jgi:hypothetical protein